MRRAAAAAVLLLLVTGCGESFVPTSSDVDESDAADIVTRGPLISGMSSWVDGVFAWTDYAYDDRGANAAARYPNGVYPSDALANAADLIQLQLSLDDAQLTIRAVLETLTEPQVPLLGIGLDLDGDPRTGAPALPGTGWEVSGTPLGLERVIVAGGATTGRVMAWQNGAWIDIDTAIVAIDPRLNTIDVQISRSSLGTSGANWRAVGVLGLATAGQSWLSDGGAILDLAYVRDTSTLNWQSRLQAAILDGREDAAQAVATIAVADFEGRTQVAQAAPGVPETFLYRSKLELGEGIQTLDRKYAGPYQPYRAWFPPGLPENPPLIVFLHGALQNHLAGFYGDADDPFTPAAVIVTPLGRGEAFGWYAGASEQDVLDVADDAQRRFDADPDRIVLSGYSLGGVGTFALSQLHPDRWAGAIEIVGAPALGLIELLGIALPQPNTLENLRNLPFRMGHARLDELEIIVGVVQPDVAALRLNQLGYDYRYWQFYLRDHLNFPVHVLQCEYEAAIARGRVINPARVVFSLEPALQWDEPDTGLQLKHDSAYWLSGLVVRGSDFRVGDRGTVDITSFALPNREPVVENIAGAGENLSGARDVCGDNPDVKTNDIWTVVGKAWEGYEDEPLSNAMRVQLTRVASVQLDLARMALDTLQPIAIEVQSDGDGTLRLQGAWPDAVSVRRDGILSALRPHEGVLELSVDASTMTLVIEP